MTRRKLRFLICTSAISVTLGGSVLTQAAGPGSPLSRIWNGRPAVLRPSVSPLNPVNWFGDDDSKATSAASGRTSVVEHPDVSDSQVRSEVARRPDLVRDPFRSASAPPVDVLTATRQAAQSTASGVSDAVRSQQDVELERARVAREVARSRAREALAAARAAGTAEAAEAAGTLQTARETAAGTVNSVAGTVNVVTETTRAPQLPDSLNPSQVQRGGNTVREGNTVRGTMTEMVVSEAEHGSATVAARLPEFLPGNSAGNQSSHPRSGTAATSRPVAAPSHASTTTAGASSASASASPTTTGASGQNQFVSGFDSEFQRLLDSVKQENQRKGTAPAASSLYDLNRDHLAAESTASRLPGAVVGQAAPAEPDQESLGRLAVKELPQEPLLRMPSQSHVASSAGRGADGISEDADSIARRQREEFARFAAEIAGQPHQAEESLEMIVRSNRDAAQTGLATAHRDSTQRGPEITPHLKPQLAPRSDLAAQAERETAGRDADAASAAQMPLSSAVFGTRDNTRQVAADSARDRSGDSSGGLILLPGNGSATVSVPVHDSSGHSSASASGTRNGPAEPTIRIMPGAPGSGVFLESDQASVVKPRVTSNAAPTRVVPDNGSVRRMGYDGDGTNGHVQADIQIPGQRGTTSIVGASATTNPNFAGTRSGSGPGHDGHDHPVLMFPSDDQDQLAASTVDRSDRAPAPDAPTGWTSDFEGQHSAVIPWPTEDELTPKPRSAGFGWLPIGMCLMGCLALGLVVMRGKYLGAGLGLLRTWKSRLFGMN